MTQAQSEQDVVEVEEGRREKPALKVIPRHVAIIMDGNGRWAKRRFLPRLEGHRQGAKTVRMVVEECRALGCDT